MLRNFENEAVAEIVGFQRVQNLRQNTTIEGNVDNSADNLADTTGNASCLESSLGCR